MSGLPDVLPCPGPACPVPCPHSHLPTFSITCDSLQIFRNESNSTLSKPSLSWASPSDRPVVGGRPGFRKEINTFLCPHPSLCSGSIPMLNGFQSPAPAGLFVHLRWAWDYIQPLVTSRSPPHQTRGENFFSSKNCDVHDSKAGCLLTLTMKGLDGGMPRSLTGARGCITIRPLSLWVLGRRQLL